jgi:hypothetical protein
MGKEPMGKYSRYNNKNVQNVFEKLLNAHSHRHKAKNKQAELL